MPPGEEGPELPDCDCGENAPSGSGVLGWVRCGTNSGDTPCMSSPCVKDTYPDGSPIPEMFRDCINAHENHHISQPDTACGDSGLLVHNPSSSQSGNECDAHNAHWECLRARYDSASEPLRSIIANEMNNVSNVGKPFCDDAGKIMNKLPTPTPVPGSFN